MRIILSVIFLLICTNVHAGYFIFHTGETITGKKASCGAVCSNDPNALRVSEVVYSSTTQDLNKVVNDAVVNKTQAEIDADVQAQADSVALAETQRQAVKDEDLANIDLSNINLPKVEAKIDAITNIAEMRTFLKRLVRYISNQ